MSMDAYDEVLTNFKALFASVPKPKDPKADPYGCENPVSQDEDD